MKRREQLKNTYILEKLATNNFRWHKAALILAPRFQVCVSYFFILVSDVFLCKLPRVTLILFLGLLRLLIAYVVFTLSLIFSVSHAEAPGAKF